MANEPIAPRTVSADRPDIPPTTTEPSRPAPPAVSELILRWQEARDRQQPLGIEQLRSGHPELADQVRKEIEALLSMEALLGSDGQTTRDTSTQAPAMPSIRDASTAVQPPTGAPTIPGYEILGELGRGGMGVVYRARQVKANRIVALKMILRITHASIEQKVRFQIEAESVARLQHPHIVQLYEVGEHDDMPFFSLEFCAGGTLSRHLRGRPPSPTDAAALVEKLARAVHFAHANGVLHRDLKPANVLLSFSRETPASAGVSRLNDFIPKITDFGLAKRTDSNSDVSRTGAILGTPSYMAPEQAAGQVRETGPATDVWALGAVLYECLTGRPPFRGATVLETLKQVQNDEPVAPSRLVPKLPRDLETICLRCLLKDPGRRYPSAEALAEDLRRFQGHEPIAARPAGRIERAVKWARRRPALAALLGVTVLAVVGLAALSVKLAKALGTADAERTEALKQKGIAQDKVKVADEAARGLARTTFEYAESEWDAGRVTLAREVLDRLPAGFRGWQYGALRRKYEGSFMTFFVPATGTAAIALNPDGLRLASWSDDGAIKVWDPNQAKVPPFMLRGLTRPFGIAAFSPDGLRLAASSGPPAWQSFASGTDLVNVRVWNLRQPGTEPLMLRGHTQLVTSLAFSPDGQQLASGSQDQKVKVWDLRQPDSQPVTLGDGGQSDPVTAVAFSPDGHWLAAGSIHPTVRIWDLRQHEARPRIIRGAAPPGTGGTGLIHQLDFSPDGQRLAAGRDDGTITVWDLRESDAQARTLRGHMGNAVSVCFSPDGQRLASGSTDQTIKVWSFEADAQPLTLYGHLSSVTGVSFSPDGQRLVSRSGDHTVKFWDLRQPDAQSIVLHGHNEGVHGVAFSAHGSRVASASLDKTVKVWDLAKSEAQPITLRGHTGWVGAVAFSPDSERVASASGDKTVKVWDLRQPDAQPFTLRGHTDAVLSVALSPDGQHLASAGRDKSVKVWNLLQPDAQPITLRGHTDAVNGVAFNPDGQHLASGSSDSTVMVWDLRQPDARAVALRDRSEGVSSVAFSPDGRYLACGNHDGTVKVWDLHQLDTPPLTLRDRIRFVQSVAFSPDGRRLAAGCQYETKVWDMRLPDSQPLTMRGGSGGVSFSESGQLLAIGGGKTVKVWDLRPPENYRFTLRGHVRVSGLAFGRDNRLFSKEGTVLSKDDRQLEVDATKVFVWNSVTGNRLPPEPPPGEWSSEVALRGDGHCLALAQSDGSIDVVEMRPPSEAEILYRGRKSAFDPVWQEQEAARHAKDEQWFATAFHLRQLLAHNPADAGKLRERLKRSEENLKRP